MSIAAKPVVIKVGGGALAGGALEDLPDLLSAGHRVAVVHGGGVQLTRMLDALGNSHAVSRGAQGDGRGHVGGGGGRARRRRQQEPRARAERAWGFRQRASRGPTGRRSWSRPFRISGGLGRSCASRRYWSRALWDGGFVPVVAPLGAWSRGRVQRQRRLGGRGPRRRARCRAPVPDDRRGRFASRGRDGGDDRP